MDGSSLGLIEIGLAFGLVLALAVFETVRNRRALQRLRREQAEAMRTDDRSA